MTNDNLFKIGFSEFRHNFLLFLGHHCEPPPLHDQAVLSPAALLSSSTTTQCEHHQPQSHYCNHENQTSLLEYDYTYHPNHHHPQLSTTTALQQQQSQFCLDAAVVKDDCAYYNSYYCSGNNNYNPYDYASQISQQQQIEQQQPYCYPISNDPNAYCYADASCDSYHFQ